MEEIRYRVLPVQNSEYKNGHTGPDGILSAPVSHLQQRPKSDMDGEVEAPVKYMRYLLPYFLPASTGFELKTSPKLDILFNVVSNS